MRFLAFAILAALLGLRATLLHKPQDGGSDAPWMKLPVAVAVHVEKMNPDGHLQLPACSEVYLRGAGGMSATTTFHPPGERIVIPTDAWWISIHSSDSLRNDIGGLGNFGSAELSRLVSGLTTVGRVGISLVGCTRLRDDDAALLQQIGSLYYLDAGFRIGMPPGPRFTRAALVAIGSLSSLEVLDISGLGIEAGGRTAIIMRGSPGGMRNANLATPAESRVIPMSDLDIPLLGNCVKLKELRIRWIPGINGEGLGGLSKCKNMEVLDTCGTSLSDSGCEMIVRTFPAIRSINVRQTRITARGLSALLNAPRLCEVYADRAVVDGASELLRVAESRRVRLSLADR